MTSCVLVVLLLCTAITSMSARVEFEQIQLKPRGGDGDDELFQLRHKLIDTTLHSQNIKGHAFFVKQWLDASTFHVYCVGDSYCRGSAPASQASKEHDCILATNANFQDDESQMPAGNLVSDGTVVQANTLMRASFGLTTNGWLSVGYLNISWIEQGYYQELLQGSLWLVRKGQSFINTSIQWEQPNPAFVAKRCSRMAIGTNIHSEIVIVQVNGDEKQGTGLDLFTFTELLLQLSDEATNFINIDGAHHASVVWDSKVCIAGGEPSDPCDNEVAGKNEPTVLPEALLSTIICFKPAESQSSEI